MDNNSNQENLDKILQVSFKDSEEGEGTSEEKKRSLIRMLLMRMRKKPVPSMNSAEEVEPV